jgi:rhodanese-related sulfurtransferase
MTQVTSATPEQVHAWLVNGEILLVDVREANEYAFERIHGALLFRFRPDPTCRRRAASSFCSAVRASAR